MNTLTTPRKKTPRKTPEKALKKAPQKASEKAQKPSPILASSETLEVVRELAQQLKTSLTDAKAENIQSYDLAEANKNYYTDVILIATASSTTHLKSLGGKVQMSLKQHGDITSLNGHKRPQQEERWVIIDCGSIVIHLFMKEDRDYYALDQKILDELSGTLENDPEKLAALTIRPDSLYNDEEF